MFTFILYHIIYRLSIDLRYSVSRTYSHSEQYQHGLSFLMDWLLHSYKQEFLKRLWQDYSWGKNFFSLYSYYNKKPYQRQGVCDTYITVHFYFLNTFNFDRIYKENTVQNTISNPMLFMNFIRQKNFKSLYI